MVCDSSSLCIFASFDENSVVQPYVYHLVNKLNAELECSRFLFVSASPSMSEIDKLSLEQAGAEVYLRENTGYDFGSYFFGINLVGKQLHTYDKVFFINDSVYGPFNPIRTLTAGNDSFDMWGLTDSWQYAYHIQSYFLCINKSGFDTLLEFIRSYEPKDNFWDVVKYGEVGLSQYFVKNQKALGAVFPIEKIIGEKLGENVEAVEGLAPIKVSKRLKNYVLSKLLIHNSCSTFWRTLLLNGFPFIKRRFLLNKTNFFAHLGSWMTIIQPEYSDALAFAKASVVLGRSDSWRNGEPQNLIDKIKVRITANPYQLYCIKRLEKILKKGF